MLHEVVNVYQSVMLLKSTEIVQKFKRCHCVAYLYPSTNRSFHFVLLIRFFFVSYFTLFINLYTIYKQNSFILE